ncbi:MAG: hypothetical protein IKL24_01490 [Clostridia bacterium]|nr:hypothetical protein [Clostridia bacterium]
MASCTFFGHRKVYSNIENELMNSIREMVIKNNVTVFYVGNHGEFDAAVLRCLKRIKTEFPNISYYVVLAYLPTENSKISVEDQGRTLFPEGIENALPKFAIIKRNMWMIEKCDYVITFVKNEQGMSARFKETAEQKGKNVVNIVK